MLKSFLFFIATVFLINVAKCRNKDTITVYFKSGRPKPYLVRNIDSADFIRLIFPSEPGNNLFNVEEFYKNGKTKLIGKTDYKFFSSFYRADIVLQGTRICFYPTGRREKIINFDPKTDLYSEFLYYPNGSLYRYTNYKANDTEYLDEFFECYNDKGDILCKEGNGRWVIYDDDYQNVILSGKIKNRHKDGEWSGSVIHYDSIKYSYSYKYKNGHLINAIGYDKLGKGYPFSKEIEMANYREGPIDFLDLFRNHLKIPRDPSGKKMSIDSLYVSFIVEKNGHLTNLQTIDKVDLLLNEALVIALAKCPEWNPTKYWGIPLRTKVVFPLNDFKPADNSPFDRHIFFRLNPIE
jgi:antitoxin component YwqK of YwqJK toxin-antitoxin module